SECAMIGSTSLANLAVTGQKVPKLLKIIACTWEKLARTRRWHLQLVGDMDLLPQPTAERLYAAEAHTSGVQGLHVNIAVGYGGRHEIAGAVRSLIDEYVDSGRPLEELSESVTVEKIAQHPYPKRSEG